MGFRSSRLGKVCLPFVLLAALCATAACQESGWPLWSAYRARFIDDHGRVIDHNSKDRTTSEAEAYAMFFALVENDRVTFDRLLSWTEANMAGGDLRARLPGWLWGHAVDGQWKLIDSNPASDADAWMAYTLLEAGRLWKAPPYSERAQAMMKRIAAGEVADLPRFGPMPMPGPVGFHRDRRWTLNPSYLPVFLFLRFAGADPNGPWRQIALRIPKLLEASTQHGFAMDWVDYIPGKGFVPAKPMLTGNPDSNVAGGSYDAIRVYLWAGMMDGEGNLRSSVTNSIGGMSAYLATHKGPPERVNDKGLPLAGDGPVGFSAAVLPYLDAIGGKAKQSGEQRARMEASRDAVTGLYGKDPAYFDQNLCLFSNGFIEKRFRFGRGGELTVQWERR